MLGHVQPRGVPITVTATEDEDGAHGDARAGFVCADGECVRVVTRPGEGEGEQGQRVGSMEADEEEGVAREER
jgi:hypothetical protein